MTAAEFDIAKPELGHAIREFSATLVFSHPMDATKFSDVAALVRGRHKEFNFPAEASIQNFFLGPAGASPATLPTIGFQRFAPNGMIEESLFCDANSITISQANYAGWQNTLPRILQLMSVIAAVYVAHVPLIRAFTLQYVNDFRAKNSSVRSVVPLLRHESKWLSPIGLDTDDLWHSHTGKFLSLTAESRYLVNVNADITQPLFSDNPSPLLQAVVSILASTQFDVPGKSPFHVKFEDLERVLSDYFTLSHTLEKKVLAETLSDEGLALIGAK